MTDKEFEEREKFLLEEGDTKMISRHNPALEDINNLDPKYNSTMEYLLSIYSVKELKELFKGKTNNTASESLTYIDGELFVDKALYRRLPNGGLMSTGFKDVDQT